MTVLVPGDIAEMQQVVDAALEHNGPVYIRLTASDVEDSYTEDNNFSIGKATELRDGNDVTIITTGIMMRTGVTAADKLKLDHGINARVLQMASVKPLDHSVIKSAVKETGLIITVEEHNILGGLGGAICEVAAEIGNARVIRMGINDHFCGIGSLSYLLSEEGLTVDKIVNEVCSSIDKHD
jgi:transketolase